MSFAWATYRVIAPALGMLAPAAGVFTSPSERPLWRERMGDSRLPGGCHAWIHAASLGEAAGVPPLLRELQRRSPLARVWLTASTRTGRARLAETGRPSSLAPLDSPQATRRFFAGVRPERIVILETEIWPHWLMQARTERIPVAMVSARLSERSVGRYRGLGSGLRELVGGLAAVLCQGEEDARRWRLIGAPEARTFAVGNLKSDGLPSPAADRGLARAGLGLDRGRPLLVLGSLRPGEARLLARAWRELARPVRDGWQVVAVPRHPRASDELAAEASEAGVTLTRQAPGPGEWQWDDRVGVLVNWYRAADAAFVGGSLTAFGGHNPLEPAACGAAVLMGRFHDSQRDYVRALEAGGAIRIVRSEAGLVPALADVLTDLPRCAALGQAAFAVAESQRGSAARAVDKLVEFGFWPA